MVNIQVQDENLKKMTRKMLRKIITTTQSLDDESDDVYVTVLLKWNSDTPPDYEPTGFTPAEYTFNLHKEHGGVRAGHVKTNFHAVGAKIRYVSFFTVESDQTFTELHLRQDVTITRKQAS